MDITKNRKSNKLRRIPKILSLTGLILLGGAVAGALAQQAPASTQSPAYRGSKGMATFQSSKQNHRQQLVQLEQKFQSVNQRIAKAQEKAAKDAAVKKKQTAFVKALYKKMEQSAPDKKTQIQQFQKLGKDLRSSAELRKPALERSKSFDQKLAKFQQLNAQLGPIEQQAVQDQQVAKLSTAYMQRLMAKMKKIEPQTDSLLRQRQQLILSIRSLQNQRSTPPSLQARPQSSTTSHSASVHDGQQSPPNK